MERVNLIVKNHVFQECLRAVTECEKDRIYCGHGLGHLLDVARIAAIINLEEGIGLEREAVYAAALLHDCGRHLQYREGTPHQEAGAVIAAPILQECGFSPDETGQIVEAIKSHRDQKVEEEPSLRGVLYRADKMSRSCYACSSSSSCSWSSKKKNTGIIR